LRECDCVEARQVLGTDRLQDANGDDREDRAEDSAERAEHETLGHELPKHAPPAGAERFADRDLARADDAAAEEQVGDVQARDQQQNRRRARDDEQVGRKSPTTSCSSAADELELASLLPADCAAAGDDRRRRRLEPAGEDVELALELRG
jgi:hypothetical protein